MTLSRGHEIVSKAGKDLKKSLNDLFEVLPDFYQEQYNIPAWRIGPVMDCPSCMHSHETRIHSDCWVLALDSAMESESDVLYENGNEYSEEAYWELYERVYNEWTPRACIIPGWFWYHGQYEIFAVQEVSGELPYRQMMEQVKRVVARRRPQKHEPFGDGNKQKFVKPPQSVMKQCKQALGQFHIFNTLATKHGLAPHDADYYFPWFRTECRAHEEEWGIENPLALRGGEFDGRPVSADQMYSDGDELTGIIHLARAEGPQAARKYISLRWPTRSHLHWYGFTLWKDIVDLLKDPKFSRVTLGPSSSWLFADYEKMTGSKPDVTVNKIDQIGDLIYHYKQTTLAV